MEDLYEISLLLDFYGQLLTARQYEIMDLHFNNDYSLGEIAEQLGISRQGVYDNIKRGRAALYGLEEKLGLVTKFSGQKARAEEIYSYLRQMESDKLDSSNRELLKKVEQCLLDIINGI